MATLRHMMAASEPIPVRNVQFAFSEATPRYWAGDDPFLTHFWNALSSTFPDGEAFFVRSVQHYRKQVESETLREEMRAFSGQEGMHGQQHLRHLQLLHDQGYPWIRRLNEFADRQMRVINRVAPRYSLAVTAALEHLTAILARQLLTWPEHWLAPMHGDMQPFWRWHATEEAEHKAVAFDVLACVSESHALRVTALVTATFGLVVETGIRQIYFLGKDRRLSVGMLWRGWRRLATKGPHRRRLVKDYLAWFRRDFHPSQIDDRALIEAASRELAEGGFASA